MGIESWRPGETAKKVFEEERSEGHLTGQTELAEHIADEQVRTAKSMLHLDEAETAALASAYRESMDRVSEAVKNAYYKDDAEGMEKARTGCSRISLENITDQLNAVHASKEDAREITNYAVAVCAQLASEGLKTQGVEIPEDTVKKYPVCREMRF